MRRWPALLVLLAACAPETPPPASPPLPAKPASKPTPPPPPPCAPAPAPLAAVPPDEPPRRALDPALPAIPRSLTPMFTIRALDGSAEVRINGRPAGRTPCAWAGTEDYDPAITLDGWPPPHAMLAASSSVLDEYGWITNELWIAGAKYADEDRAALRRLHPHLAEDEHVVYVRTGDGRRMIFRGAFRLAVEGRRFVLHRPTHVSEESEDAQRWNRMLWFERD